MPNMKEEITIKNFLDPATKTDLLDKSLHAPAPEKRKVYDTLYTYFLDKRQDEVIKRRDFVR